jgi:hypothetical protein
VKHENISELETVFEIRCMDDDKFEPFFKDIKDKCEGLTKYKKEMTIFLEKIRVYLSKVVFC